MVENQDGNHGTVWKTEHVTDTVEKRTFTGDQLFEWHRDYDDRSITVIAIKGEWSFQYDNQFPFQLRLGQKFFVKRGIWHRLIPMYKENQLTVQIEHMNSDEQ